MADQGLCDDGYMFGGRSIQLFRVFGIRIGVDPTWFFVLFLVIWWMSQHFKDIFPGQDTKPFILATVSAHDQAVQAFPAAIATRAQYPLLAVMITLTIGAVTLVFTP